MEISIQFIKVGKKASSTVIENIYIVGGMHSIVPHKSVTTRIPG